MSECRPTSFPTNLIGAELDAVAALIEAQEQVKLWTARAALRRAALERLPKDGSPIGALEAAERFGVSSTD